VQVPFIKVLENLLGRLSESPALGTDTRVIEHFDLIIGGPTTHDVIKQPPSGKLALAQHLV
jgi:hypothetical protein